LSKEQIEKDRTEFCKVLVRTGAIKFGVFTLTSGKLSPYYVDLRIVPSFPEALSKVEGIYEGLVKKAVGIESFQRIAGIPTAGVPFASILSFRLRKPFLYIRKEAKSHGRERRVEGLLSPGEKILIVDDLITTGKSTGEAIEAIRSEGGLVEDAVVLIDREEGGAKHLKTMGVTLHAFMKISEIAKELYALGAIEESKFQDILRQRI
jgi:orotate phosphoribosyltransferase